MLRDNRLELVRHSTFVMGQIANVTILHRDVAQARRAVTSIFEELRRLERMMSVYDGESEVSAINAAAGRDGVKVSPEMIELLGKSVAASLRSRDALDITVNPLLRLWGFRGESRPARPSDREVKEALDAVAIGGLKIEGETAGLTRSGASIDLGGVAVGYALDRTAAMLRREGITSALIELSGDFHAVGAPPESRGWEIGVQDPRREGGILETLHIRDQALSTSGNYANTVVYDARSYGHIFDPSRGLPAERLLSATVVAPTAFEADAYSTALFVSGDRAILPNGGSAVLLGSHQRASR